MHGANGANDLLLIARDGDRVECDVLEARAPAILPIIRALPVGEL